MTKKIVIEIRGLADGVAAMVLPQLKMAMPVMVKQLGPGMTKDNLAIIMEDEKT